MIKRLFNALIIVSMLVILVPVAVAAPPAQAKGQDYIVVKDDPPSKSLLTRERLSCQARFRA